jgi:hypothetical protein
MGFSIPIKFLTSEFSNNRFLKTSIGTLKLKFLNLSTNPKLTCTQITHSFKKNIVEAKMLSLSEKKTQNQYISKSLHDR